MNAQNDYVRTIADAIEARVAKGVDASEMEMVPAAACGAETGDATLVAIKPCLTLDYCPYGVLVEQFPLATPGDQRGCEVFGHLCPAFSVAYRGDNQ